MNASPLLLVPGLMCDHAVWAPVLSQINAVSACTIVDHGQADSLEKMAVQILRDAPTSFCIAGHSMGARVAMEVWRLAPDRVRGIALLDTGYLPKMPGEEGEEEVRKRMRLLHMAQDQGVRVMAMEWAQGMVHPDRLNDVELMEAIFSMFERKSAETFALQIHALIQRPDATDVLSSLNVPTLIACGRHDAWSTLGQHEAMHRLAPQAVLEVIEDAGHMAPMEKPDAFAQVILRWLARVHSAQ